MEAYKETIASILINGEHMLTQSQQRQIDKISEGIDYAWNNWDENILETYYEGEKPIDPTESFITQYVENEDFEANGYDVDYLEEIF